MADKWEGFTPNELRAIEGALRSRGYDLLHSIFREPGSEHHTVGQLYAEIKTVLYPDRQHVTVSPRIDDKVQVKNPDDVYFGRKGVIVGEVGDRIRVKLDLGNNFMHTHYRADELEIIELAPR